MLQEVFADEIVLEPHGRKSGNAVDERSQEDKGHLEADGLNTVTYHFCTELNLKRVKKMMLGSKSNLQWCPMLQYV